MSASPHPTIFLDFGGVIGDNALLAPQWQRLGGEFLSQRLGGELQAWAEANRTVFRQMWPAYWDEHLRKRPDTDFLTFWSQYLRDWLRRMCAHVGVPAPDSDGDCLRTAQEASAYVTSRANAAYPGITDVLRDLHARGYALYTASGNHSQDLQGYLGAMGVRDLFVRLYGPDLINAPKEGPLYYERIFADSGVDPRQAIVIDDSPLPIAWASETGARAVLVSTQVGHTPSAYAVICGLADLPSLLQEIEGR